MACAVCCSSDLQVSGAAPKVGEVVARIAGDGSVEVEESVLGVASSKLNTGILDQLRYGSIRGNVRGRECACEREQPEGDGGESEYHGGLALRLL